MIGDFCPICGAPYSRTVLGKNSYLDVCANGHVYAGELAQSKPIVGDPHQSCKETILKLEVAMLLVKEAYSHLDGVDVSGPRKAKDMIQRAIDLAESING